MTGDCAACGRSFKSLTVFDAHRQWDYTKPSGDQLTCLDPATLLDRDGKPRFRLNGRGQWVHAAALPPGAFEGSTQTAEQPAPGASGTPVHPEPVEAR
jgi:hypothetical protein